MFAAFAGKVTGRHLLAGSGRRVVRTWRTKIRLKQDATSHAARHKSLNGVSMLLAMWLAEIWRYPVKSMAGEMLATAELGGEGIPGDRLLQVQDGRRQTVTSRSRPRLLLHHATLGADGQPLVDGRSWNSPEVARDVQNAGGRGARLVRSEGLDRFDVLPLLVATDGAIDALGYDRRRFRPNLLLAGVPGFAEREWESRYLHVGGAVIHLVDLRRRCIMTTFDPDTAAQDTEVLVRVHRELDGVLALNARVVRPGRISVGDRAEVREAA